MATVLMTSGRLLNCSMQLSSPCLRESLTINYTVCTPTIILSEETATITRPYINNNLCCLHYDNKQTAYMNDSLFIVTMLMLMLILQIYLRAESCNRVTTVAPWESSSVVSGIVQVAWKMILGIRTPAYSKALSLCNCCHLSTDFNTNTWWWYHTR